MGNRLCRRRGSTIEERFTKPQRLVRQPSNVDYKKLRKLIQSRKLAPCFDGVEDFNPDLEECPICFFYYPSLNRSRCCMKGICTECFLQMKPSSAARPAQCPFCKSSSYAVEYHGARTQEEKNLEQAEEQKVIEAKIRMQTRESQNVDQIALDQISSNSELQSPTSFGGNSSGDSQETRDSDGQIMGERIGVAQSPERQIEFNLDFEAIMMTEAILQSLQDSTIRKNVSHQSSAPSGSGGIQISTPKSNRSGSSSSPADPSEVILAESVTRQLALAIMQSDEQSEPTNDQRCKTEDQNCEEEYRDPLLEMQSATDSASTELNEVGSETGCLASSFATETDSWESLSARLLERNEDLEAGFTSDEDALGASDGGSSWLSSVHSISDRSCGGSPNCSDDEVGPSCCIVPSPNPAEQENL